MNKQVEDYIPKALKAIKKHIVNNEEIYKKYNGAIPSEYNGYIASFGAAITKQFNLKAAIACASSTSSGSAKNKIPLMNTILEVIEEQEEQKDVKEAKLLAYVLKHKEKEPEIKDKIINAVIAIKLAIRTFELKKENES